jgi:hypothetical protein
MTTLNDLKQTLKGGAGSGHRGHDGRPGKRGGSSPGGGGGATSGDGFNNTVVALQSALYAADGDDYDGSQKLFNVGVDFAQKNGVDMSAAYEKAREGLKGFYKDKLTALSGVADAEGKISVFDPTFKKEIGMSDRKAFLKKGYLDSAGVRHYRITGAGKKVMEE